MTRPVVADISERIYTELAPYSGEDLVNEWALLVLCGSIGAMAGAIDSYASEGPNGEAGWSMIVDVDRAPLIGLPWLGQLVGVKVNTNLSEADQRQQIKEVNGWQRGSPGAIKAAPAPFLIGSKVVVFRERDAAASPKDPSAGLTIITYAAETLGASIASPDLLTLTNVIDDATRAAALEGDGRQGDGSISVWEANENLEATAGGDVSFEAGTTGYTTGAGNSIALDPSQFKGGTKSVKATYGGSGDRTLLSFHLTLPS